MEDYHTIFDDDLERLGGIVAFYTIKWDSGNAPFNMRISGNINYYSLADNATREHTHKYPEIILVLSGSIRHIINNEEQQIRSSSLLFIRPNDTHYFQQLDSDSCELIIFSFQLELLLNLSEYLENDFFMWHFTESVVAPLFKIPRDDIEQLSVELLRINRSTAIKINRVRIKAILAKLFTTYFLDFSRLEEKESPPEWFSTLCQKMYSPKNLRSGLDAMKKLAHCTPEHLCKICRHYLDKSPTEFINDLRMRRAEELLKDKRLEICDVATELGITSLSRFYYLFKKYYGVTPAHFRKTSDNRNIFI